MTKPCIKISKLGYFPITKHWHKLKPLFESKEAENLWRFNLRDYAQQKSCEHKFRYKYDESRYRFPADHDGCDWRCCRNSRHPEWWDYVCHSACHWLVDMNLWVAMQAYPEVPWQIITQRHHSTIWNGDKNNPVLFDLNFLALEVTAKQAWKIASRGRFLKPRQYLRPYVFNKGYFQKPAMKLK